jgi:molecular chaperone DnaK
MKVESGIQALRETLKGDDTDAIKKASEALTSDMQAISADLYAQAKQSQPGAGPAEGGTPPPPPPNAGGKADGDVMDADFEMVDDDKDSKK